jgi:hypothetical protein
MNRKLIAGLIIGSMFFSGFMLGFQNQDRYFLALKSGMHLPVGERFSEVYRLLIDFGIAFDIRILPVLSIWMQADYISGEGELTVSGDPVHVMLIPGTIGIKTFFPSGRATFFAGAGGSYVYYRENSDTPGIQSHRTSQPGYVVTAGVLYKLGILELVTGLEYRGLKIPAEYDDSITIDAGGLSVTVGVGLSL